MIVVTGGAGFIGSAFVAKLNEEGQDDIVVVDELGTTEKWQNLVEKLPLKRAATLDEITSTLEFLIKNEYITGQTIVVDGGYSLV